MIKFTCTKDLFRILHGEKPDKRKTLRSHHLILKDKLIKYLSGILSTDNYGADLEKKTNQFTNDISDFNNKHLIKCNNKPISYIADDPCYISSMTPTRFINVQDELRFYFNSSFQVLSFNIFFRT